MARRLDGVRGVLGRVGSVSSRVGSVSSRVGSMSGRVRSVPGRVGSVSGRVRSMSSRVRGVLSRVRRVPSRVDGRSWRGSRSIRSHSDVGGLGRENSDGDGLVANNVCGGLVLRNLLNVDGRGRSTAVLSDLRGLGGLRWVSNDGGGVDRGVVRRSQVGRVVRLVAIVAHRRGVRHPSVGGLGDSRSDVARDRVDGGSGRVGRRGDLGARAGAVASSRRVASVGAGSGVASGGRLGRRLDNRARGVIPRSRRAWDWVARSRRRLHNR